MQIYKEMNIGTAKVTREEMEGIPHYMLDIVNPNERYSVSEYKKQAEKCIEEIIKKGKVPVVVGGTGLYIDSLVYGIEFEQEEFDEQYRNELTNIAKKEGLDKLYNLALQIDEKAAKKISPNDEKRILRILEIYNKTGKTKTEREIFSRQKEVKYDYKVFVININREELYKRINKRVDEMIEQGLIEEVKKITAKYTFFPTAMQGIGYKEVINYLNGNLTREEMIEEIKKGTRHYAKRQITWFKKNRESIWIDGESNPEDNIEIIKQTLIN